MKFKKKDERKSAVKMLEHLVNEIYVHFQVNGNRCMIITGPNMGGKSSYIKQVITRNTFKKKKYGHDYE